MPNLVIDIGNSFSKIAIFDNRELVFFERKEQWNTDDIDLIIDQYAVTRGIISSVAEQTTSLEAHLESRIALFKFSTADNPGIVNDYQSIETLGLDRWAKVVAAFKLYHGDHMLMIDAGTCITYDVLSSKSIYKGGSISLGIHMRFKALNHYTGRLPLVSFDQQDEIIPEGNNTTNALKNGVLRGIVNEIEGFIKIESDRNSSLKVVLTGGDAYFLSKQLKNSIFADQIRVDPYLVLRGLNEVIAL